MRLECMKMFGNLFARLVLEIYFTSVMYNYSIIFTTFAPDLKTTIRCE
jgi:hypothetical protein